MKATQTGTAPDHSQQQAAQVWGIAVMCGYLVLLPLFLAGELVRQLRRRR